MKRIAILNRGEPALRFIRALCEYNLERDSDIQSIAFYTNEDEHAPFVHQASETICFGDSKCRFCWRVEIPQCESV